MRPRPAGPGLACIALAILVLALGAEAACTAGYLQLDLISTTGTSCNANQHALCLSSFQIGIAADCKVALTPLLGSGVYAPGIWSSNPSATYARLVACPSWTTATVDPGSSSASPDQLKAAIKTALQQHVYGASYELGVSSVVWSEGTVTVNTVAGGCALEYAITQVSPADDSYSTQIGADAVRATCNYIDPLQPELGGSLGGVTCVVGFVDSCPLGTRPVNLASGKACALCRAGTYSATGSGCTSCSSGRYVKSVGATSCNTQCAAGSYSTGGLSECLPCNAGTYQATAGQASCGPCPYNSYARLPGATLCVRCVAGVAKCVTGYTGGCDADNAEAPSPGYQLVSITTPSTLRTATCALDAGLSYGNPALFGQCTLTAGSTYLSLYVNEYCGVQISPVKDAACSEPAASYWSSMKISGHYVTPALIASSLNTASTNLTSSYLMTLVPTGAATLTMTYWPATTDVSKAAAVSASSQTCSGTAEVIGGQVNGVPTTPAACPAGSYDNSEDVDGCRPCPVGSVCGASSTAATSCSADEYQPLLGQSTGACTTCNATAVPRYTSNAGDDYCLVPWIDTTCTDGYEYDADSTTCSICPAGTQRKVGREEACTPCLPGYYSPAGASDCVACPVNQFAPVYGLGQRTLGDQKCIYCPTGSVAVTDAGTTGETASTGCDPCAPGTIASIVAPRLYATCEACADGYYRSGDAYANNNVCKQIPAGYKERARADTTYDRAQIQLCSKGEVSSWNGATRTPTDPEACSPCLGTAGHAPRSGLTICRICRAGTRPTKSDAGLLGNDMCTACTDNTYRAASSNSATCLVCTAGREVHASGNTACLPCIEGFYMPDNLGGSNITLPANGDSCLPCPVNSYQPNTGRAACVLCPAGSSTEDTGNTACQPCSSGFYSPNTSTTCVPAPRGTYVPGTGAKMYTPCPFGTFNNDLGMDDCDACSAGQYSNTLGAKWCKTCPAGTISGSQATNCKTCSPGYSSPAGSGACSPCKPGFFASGSGSGACTPCTLGNQCPTVAMRNPQPCPRGYFSNKQGARLCVPCPANTYQDVIGQRNCKACAKGYTTRGLGGQSVCQAMRANVLVPGRRLLSHL